MNTSTIIEYRITCVLEGLKRGWAFTSLQGKVPTRQGWGQEQPSMFQAMVDAYAGNIGLRTGKVSRVIVLDEDVEGAVAKLLYSIPETPTVITSTGKHHYYFQWSDCKLKKLGNGIDVISDGKQVVFPGSIHPTTGEMYRWREGRSITDTPLADIPEALIAK